MSTNILKEGKILIIDDEKVNVRLLEMMLQEAGYDHLHSTTDAREALTLFRSIQPDLVLLDLAMPHLDGFTVMKQLYQEMPDHAVPILVLTADATLTTRHKALKGGASDFLTKPLDEIEVLLRISHLLEIRFQHVLMEARVLQRTQELEKSQIETLQRLAMAAEYRDDDTGIHIKRVGNVAGQIAWALGLSPEKIGLITRTAPLHDVGKIGISDAILLKPGKLDDVEFDTMKLHTVIGAKMLSGSTSPWLQMAEEIALSHHERWDGQGYPNQLAGDDIPLVGRITTIADVFDALTHERPYKKAWPVAEAVEEIKRQSGQQFDERVVQAFVTLPHETFV